MLNIIAGVALAFIGSPEIAHAQALEAASSTFPVAEYATTTEGLIAHFSEEYGVSGIQMLGTLSCESGLNPRAIGDQGTSFGIAQIHLPAHPDITQEQAFDKKWAIEWMAKQFKAGKEYWWTCYRQLYLLE